MIASKSARFLLRGQDPVLRTNFSFMFLLLKLFIFFPDFVLCLCPVLSFSFFFRSFPNGIKVDHYRSLLVLIFSSKKCEMAKNNHPRLNEEARGYCILPCHERCACSMYVFVQTKMGFARGCYSLITTNFTIPRVTRSRFRMYQERFACSKYVFLLAKGVFPCGCYSLITHHYQLHTVM